MYLKITICPEAVGLSSPGLCTVHQNLQNGYQALGKMPETKWNTF